MTGRRAAALLVALAVAMLVAETLQISAARPYPRYDEVSYLALGRAMAHEGGLPAQVGCYLAARCKEDNRPPLYQMVMAPFLDDTPGAFARAKLVELAMTLLLIATVVVVVRRTFSPTVAVGSALLLCLMPVMPDYGARLMHDVLFCALTFAAVFAIAAWQERGAARWFVIGGLIGLAFLTKGSGHLLWLPLLVTAGAHHRGRLWRRPVVYAAAAGFFATAFFLLIRNVKLWGSPFYNVNSAEVWVDSWRDALVMRLTPERAQLGLGWYLHHHSLLDLAIKLGRGFGEVVGLFVYTAGFGAANVAIRVVTGLGVMALAALGLRRRWRAGHRSELLAVLSTVALFVAALSLAASGAPGPQVRYVLPYVVLLLPFAVHEAIARFGPGVEAWSAARFPRLPHGALVLVGVALWLAVRLALALPGIGGDPRRFYAVDPRAHETSSWLSAHLAPGESFALPFESYYSTWDVPRPELDPRWFIWFGIPSADLLRFMQERGISKVVIDMNDSGKSGYADKLGASAADGHGPLSFLGWPRCFTDGGLPSRFLVYCRP
jgi:4-amino-4-deoxy-L-arabinose transferase-like glycosyltransferase